MLVAVSPAPSPAGFPIRAITRLDPPTYRDPVIALIDLPDNRCAVDLCVVSNHFNAAAMPITIPYAKSRPTA